MNTILKPAVTLFAGILLGLLPGPTGALAKDELCVTPPMGWNSYNSFGSTVTEQEVRAHADAMAEQLKPLGWQYLVIDILWCDAGASGFVTPTPASFAMDEWGRFIPDVSRFPSSANGQGFKPLADYIHGKGLKFGIHIMRGIPRQAFAQNTPILGTKLTARDIADTNSLCPWNKDLFGVDMRKPGAQEYYNSLFKLYASWGVDYVKIDDMENPDTKQYHAAEMEGYRKAMDRCGRPMVCSISPRIDYSSAHGHIEKYANLWRVSDDFWDSWPALKRQFTLLHQWEKSIAPGRFPDADMLIFGRLNQRGPQDGPPRESHFTADERRTVMSLWCIARSPLMYGGDLVKIQPADLALLTNPEVLAVNQNSEGNRQLYSRNEQVAWVASLAGSKDVYVALFNLADEAREVSVSGDELGCPGELAVRDLWDRKDLGTCQKVFARKLPPHGSALLRITRSNLSVPPQAQTEPACYLFSYFRDNGEDGLHLASSPDGLKWTPLNDGQPFLKPEVGGKLMRDPCIVRGQDGTFHMVWTTSWSDQGIGTASSKDLIHWSAQTFVPVMKHEPKARNCWAPEITWDPLEKQFAIYWATTVPGRFPATEQTGDDAYNHRIYFTTTRDFKSFADTALLYDPGFNVIDSTILYHDGRFVMILKDETRNPPAKNLRVATANKLAGPWVTADESFTPKGLWVEGPSLLKVGDWWYVYFDAYQDHRYGAMRTKDFKHWEDISDRISFPPGVRHGTAFAMPSEIAAKLLPSK